MMKSNSILFGGVFHLYNNSNFIMNMIEQIFINLDNLKIFHIFNIFNITHVQIFIIE